MSLASKHTTVGLRNKLQVNLASLTTHILDKNDQVFHKIGQHRKATQTYSY